MASMCKLGFDIGLKEMSSDELTYCQTAVANWKRLQPAVMDGDQYRLVSPYTSNHMAWFLRTPATTWLSIMSAKIWARLSCSHTTSIHVSRKN